MSIKLPDGASPDLSIPQVAALRQVHTDTVRRAIARGDLKAYRVGRQIRIRPQDLERWGRRIGGAA
jgi:excisionase family DNA binding protein